MTCRVDGCGRQTTAKGLCVAHYRQQARGQPLTPLYQAQRARWLSLNEVVEHLLSKVVVEDECWTLPGRSHSRGYPDVSYQGKICKVGRLVLEVYEGPPNGRYMIHECHNPRCVNPKHLRWGSSQENALDKSHAGRHHNQMLTSSDIPVIRKLFDDGESYADIGLLFGVNAETVRAVRRRISWAHIAA